MCLLIALDHHVQELSSSNPPFPPQNVLSELKMRLLLLLLLLSLSATATFLIICPENSTCLANICFSTQRDFWGLFGAPLFTLPSGTSGQ